MDPNYKRFFEHSVDLFCIAGADGYFKEVNPAWERVMGYTRAELLARPFFEIIHPEDIAASVNVLEEGASGAPIMKFINRLRTKAGAYRWLRWSGTNYQGLYYGLARDITDELEAADAHQDREKQLQSIASNVPGMLYRFQWTSGQGYSFAYVGPRSNDIFELEASQILSNPFLLIDQIVPEDRPGFDAQMAEATVHVAPFRWEGRIQTPSGKAKWIRVSGDGRKVPDGKLYWDGHVEDISLRKQTEALLLEQQAKMVNSSKLASLGEMAGGVAHEINNPLAILKGYALQIRKLLDEGGRDMDKIDEAAERIEATVDRIARIVVGLRKVSRDSTHDTPVSYPVSELVSDTLSLCTERLRSHGIHLEVSELDPHWRLHCRPVELSQVLLNLLNNAHDAIEKASERWIRLEVEEDGPYLRLSVTDSGKGIPAPLRDKILMPFFTTKPVGRGTGLGLSISKSIVESHGGTLTLDEASSRTRFVVCLPREFSA